MPSPRQVADRVMRLGSEQVNWYLVADDTGVTVVDAGLSGYRSQLEPGLEALGCGPGDVRAVVLTHGDADHTGLAKAIHDETGAPVHVHPGDEEMVRTARLKKTEGSMLGGLTHPLAWRTLAHFARNGALRPPKVAHTTPLEDGATLEVPGRPQVIHTPGHTPGHVAFLFPAHRALFVGDMLCTWNPVTGERGPRVMPPAFNVSTSEARTSLALIENLDAGVVLAGHGDPFPGSPAEAVAQAREGA
jgi:glyoxylase-like metal-dependent hydrolase (beta-lactamase superfamily II)